MATPLSIIKYCYESYARNDVEGILEFVTEDVDWECVAPKGLPYAGRRRSREGVLQFFADISATDDVKFFQPREFIEAGENVIVLGSQSAVVRSSGRRFDTEWIHLFTVREERIIRWRGFFDTAAREG